MTPAPTLQVRSTSVAPDQLPANLVDLLPPGAPASCWIRRGDGLVGWGQAARFEFSGGQRFAALQSWWDEVAAAAAVDDSVDAVGSGLICWGSLTYAATSEHTSVLVVPEVVVGRRGEQAWVTTIGVQPRERPELSVTSAPNPVPHLAWRQGPLSAEVWQGRVAQAVHQIAAGDLDKVVMARGLRAESEQSIDLRAIVASLVTHYPATWTFAVDGLVGATPELLIRRDQDLVTSRVLAGTITRSGAASTSRQRQQEDLRRAATLIESTKDLAEHAYAVRSVVEALREHTRSLNVPDAASVLHLPNVMHLVTDISGVASDHLSSLRLAGVLHPSAAVCGTPRDAADAVIRDLEGMDRGRYAAPVGWMAASGDGEWGVALRCGQLSNDARRIELFAGCGIVADSDPAREVAESDAKFIPMLDALTPRR